MRRPLFRPAMFLAFTLLGLAAARAQEPGLGGFGPLGGMAPGGGGPLAILTAPAVQDELKLTDAQKTKILELARTAGQKGRDMVQAMFFSGGNADPQALMTAGASFRRENEQAIAKVLEPKQRERLSQIALRVEGPLAVARPEVAARLNLNQAQSEAVQEITGQMLENLRQMFLVVRQQAGGQFDPSRMGQVREMAAQIRQDAVQQVGKILERKQKANFNKMLGAPFDVSKIDPQRLGTAGSEASPGHATAKPAEKSAKPPDSADAAKTTDAKSADRPARKKGRSKP